MRSTYFYPLIMLFLIYYLFIFTTANCENVNETVQVKKGPKLNMKQNIMLNQIIAAYTVDISQNSLCKNHTKKYKEGIRMFEPWALKMLDASSKLQTGILTGNTGEFGSYDQCLKIHTLTEYGEIYGQMCTVDIIPGPKMSRNILKIRNLPPKRFDQILSTIKFDSVWMICLPDTCSYVDVQTHLNKTIQSITEGLDLKISVEEDGCISRRTSKPLTKLQWISVFSLGGLLIFVLVCTLYEICMKNCGIKPNQGMLIFSAYSNTKFLLSSGENELDCLNGVRALSILWVILGHRYFLTIYVPIINGLDILDWMQTFPSAIIVGGTVSVDTFFMMSGLLLTYLYLTAMNKGVPFNLILFYLRRYIRVSGPLAVVVLFFATLVEFTGAGPLWSKTTHGLKDPCVQYWWSTLLHIQNYINPSKLCVIQTWYLSCDMQFYFFSPIIIYPIWKWQHFGLFLLLIWFIVSIVVSFEAAWINNFNGGMPVTNELLNTKYFMYHYVPSHTRVSPYLMGIAFGYILFMTKDKKIKFNPALKTLGWTISLATFACVVFGSLSFDNLYHEYNRMESSIFLALSRPAWTLGLMWVVFNCIHGMAEPINKFLSLYVFKVIAKLSYCMFLTHIGIMFARNGAEKVAYHFSDFDMVYFFFGDLGFTLMFSIVLALCVEFPIMKLDGLFRNKVDQKKVERKVEPK